MITKWNVLNFKSIRKETGLNLAPLTIFAGANSSGKSTFIQSILLVAQTLAHKVDSRSVVLNGPLTSLGQFDDIKSDGSESEQISIKYTCQPTHYQDLTYSARSKSDVRYLPRFNRIKKVSCEISFGTDESSSQRDLLQIHPRLFSTRISSTFRSEEDLNQNAHVSIHYSSKVTSDMDAVGKAADRLRAGLHYEINLDDVSMEEIKDRYKSAQPVGCLLQHFLPRGIICEIDKIQEDANDLTYALQHGTYRTRFPRRSNTNRPNSVLSEEIIAVLRGLLRKTIDLDMLLKKVNKQQNLFGPDSEPITLRNWNWIIHSLPRDDQMQVRQALFECKDLSDHIYSAIKKSGTYTNNLQKIPVPSPNQITDSIRYLDNFFSSHLRYLGPLRDSPKPLYPIASAYDPDDIGLRGENTSSILELYKNREITYIPSSSFKSSVIKHKPTIETLETAVSDWLEYLGVASSVKSRDMGKLGYELKVKYSRSDNAHDLTHVGVGVSQVLPILVMCLLSDTDSTLVFEQPELHLHPKVQALLGDFFLSMALCSKQCIVETHSEYFLNRLRFRIAEASPESKLDNKAKIYFVEKTSQGSSFHEVVINEYGAILDWPKGFFDQSQRQSEELLRAATMKRKNGRRNTDS